MQVGAEKVVKLSPSRGIVLWLCSYHDSLASLHSQTHLSFISVSYILTLLGTSHASTMPMYINLHLMLLVLNEISNPCKACMDEGSVALLLAFLVASVEVASITCRILARYSFGGCCWVLRVLSLTSCHFFSSELCMTTCLLSSGRSIASWKSNKLLTMHPRYFNIVVSLGYMYPSVN